MKKRIIAAVLGGMLVAAALAGCGNASNDNAKILQILDLLKNLDRYLDCSYDEARKKIKKHSLANHITRESIDKYIRNFPDSTFRFYYEMQLDKL